MAIEFFWRLPTSGDGRFGDAERQKRGERDLPLRPIFSPGVTDPRGNKFNYFDYLHQVARAVDLSGFNGIHIPDDADGDESWIVAGYVARSTRRLTLLTEFDAARGSAVYAAKNAVSFQRFTGGRFAWQITQGSSEQERRRAGDFVSDADILPRIEEFITASRGVLTQSPYSFSGQFFEVLNGGFQGPLGNQKVPPVYLSGNSEEAYRLSAKLADVHVLDAVPVEELKAEIAKLEAWAGEQGRSISLALRIDVLARETHGEAVFDALRYLEQSGISADSADVSTGPHLWKGFATHHTGAGASLVGSYEQVAGKLAEYADAGITQFILAAIPHLEEAYRIGTHVLPAVRSLTSHADKRVA